MDKNSNKKSRNRFSIEQQYAICNHYLMFSGLSQVELGEWARKEFNISGSVSQKTISNILSRKDEIFRTFKDGNLKGKSNRSIKMPQLDKEIENYIDSMSDKNIPINRAAVILYAKVVANKKYKMNELPAKDQIKFSDGWLSNVFKRIGVKCRHMYGENNSVNLDSPNIIEVLKKIEQLLEPYDLKDIMNFDETGLYYEQQPTRTISKKPIGGSKKSKNRFTVGFVTNYDGSYKGHPIVIGRRKTPGAATKKPALYRKTTSVGQSHYVEYHSSPSAWMTTEIFKKYIKHLNASFVYANRKVALLVGNASVHKLKMEFNNIKLVFLPANTTSKLQPLDDGKVSLHLYHCIHIIRKTIVY